MVFYNSTDLQIDFEMNRRFAMSGWKGLEKAAVLGAFLIVFLGNLVYASTLASTGTGFFIHPDGYILTCQHVIEGVGKIEVMLSDSSRYVAEVVEEDAYKDLALLKISIKNAPYVILGDSEHTRVLETVFALGYPLKIGNEVSANEGKINAKRDSEKIPLFQIDAVVNSGNSGGPLINDHGEAIGIIVAKLNAVKYMVLTGTIPEGINFAIPILYAKSLLVKMPPLKTTAKSSIKLSPPDIFEKISPATVRIEKYEPVNPIIQAKLKTITIPLANLPSGSKPLEMVLIPAGTFTMGSPSYEKDRYDGEGPQHPVTITKPFYMGKYEVTQAQWQAVMGSNPSDFKDKPNNPVEQVSWNDCQTFIEKLNQMGQGTFCLPTEAEWEYACRAGTQTRFYWGDDPNYSQIKDYVWYSGNNSPDGTKEVGQKIPNGFGLYDMSGNVYEWCQDWYGGYSSMLQIDPKGANSGSYRVLRGGTWSGDAGYCRSAHRSTGPPGLWYDGIGFRLVLSRTE
jgi:formylglycine-generating enzyme required for sulfatase activity